MGLHVSEPGYAVVRSFEGRSLKAYKDEVGVWTIGYGNTNADAAVLGFTIKAGVTITEDQADQLLRAAMIRQYEPDINSAMYSANPTQAQFDAGGSFHYNTGAIKRASWVKSFVAHNLPAVHSQIMLWNKAGGKALAGLTRRRNREWEMIDKGDYGPEGASKIIVDEHGKPIAPAPHTTTPVVPMPSLQSWHERMESILGLYEFPGESDNPAIVAMAEQCGGAIARDYKHDSTPWCALTVNWCLITTGFKGDDSLAALDFRKTTQRLDGPCVGAIATMTRQGGGHVFIVRGRTADNKIVGTGGNQSDMVCDEVFDPGVCQFGWPKEASVPVTVGVGTMPVVEARPHTHKEFTSLPGHPALQNANPPVPGPGMLHLGDSGPEVADAKAQMKQAGYDLSGEDVNVFGPKMDAAVRDFQRRHPQLQVTGYYDPATRKALQRDFDMRTKTSGTVVKGGVTGAGTAGADAATHGHAISSYVYLGIGVIVVAVLAYIAWTYRDEIRAMFTKRQA